jgi:hypothetical protein
VNKNHKTERSVAREKLARLFDMTDRTVIATGGTRGIGRAFITGHVVFADGGMVPR